jgi:hypothetical protein
MSRNISKSGIDSTVARQNPGASRRGFLAMLGIGAAVATIDPERLIWQPGKRLISIPSDRQLKVLVQYGTMRFANDYQRIYNNALAAWMETRVEAAKDLKFYGGTQW